ncbi:MAG TPA: NADPH-dependent FMN reductase [Polyangiaceae bacterium]|nr:NADPH-dependent FMN reductase [Polyangiaceae bacterium]
MAADPFRILLISGSTRSASTNTAALRTAQVVAPLGVVATLYRQMVELPHFNPDDDRGDDAVLGSEALHPVVAALRREIASAHAVLFSTPEYAGALPGSFKNLLDWTVGGDELYGKPGAWLNVSSSPTGAAQAHASLATVLGYLNVDIVEAACARIPVAHADVGPDGLIAAAAIREEIARVLWSLAQHISGQR